MKNLELIHCYQHLLANPANIRWARQCTQALCIVSPECLLNIPFPPASLEKVLGIRWPSPNTDRHDHQKTHSPLLGPLLVHLPTASFENVLENRCLSLNTDFLMHSLSSSHVPFLPQLVSPVSFENVLDFHCFLGAHVSPTSDARYFLMFPHLSTSHHSAIFENVLCIRWHYCAVPSSLSFLHFVAPLLTPVLHLLHFPTNFLNVLRNRCSACFPCAHS